MFFWNSKKKQLESAETIISEQRSKIEALDTELQQLKQRLSCCQEDTKECLEELNQKDYRIKFLEMTITNRDNAIDNFNNTINSLNEENDKLKKIITDYEYYINNL